MFHHKKKRTPNGHQGGLLEAEMESADGARGGGRPLVQPLRETFRGDAGTSKAHRALARNFRSHARGPGTPAEPPEASAGCSQKHRACCQSRGASRALTGSRGQASPARSGARGRGRGRGRGRESHRRAPSRGDPQPHGAERRRSSRTQGSRRWRHLRGVLSPPPGAAAR